MKGSGQSIKKKTLHSVFTKCASKQRLRESSRLGSLLSLVPGTLSMKLIVLCLLPLLNIVQRMRYKRASVWLMKGLAWRPYPSCHLWPSSAQPTTSKKLLIHTKHAWTSPLGTPLPPLLAVVKRGSGSVIATKVVEILDFVDANDPVLASEGLFHSADFGRLRGKSHVTDPIYCLTWRKHVLEVVVRQFVPVHSLG